MLCLGARGLFGGLRRGLFGGKLFRLLRLLDCPLLNKGLDLVLKAQDIVLR